MARFEKINDTVDVTFADWEQQNTFVYVKQFSVVFFFHHCLYTYITLIDDIMAGAIKKLIQHFHPFFLWFQVLCTIKMGTLTCGGLLCHELTSKRKHSVSDLSIQNMKFMANT